MKSPVDSANARRRARVPTMTTTTAPSRMTSLPTPAAARRPRVPPRELVQSPPRARTDPQAERPRRPRPPPRRPAMASYPSASRRRRLALKRYKWTQHNQVQNRSWRFDAGGGEGRRFGRRKQGPSKSRARSSMALGEGKWMVLRLPGELRGHPYTELKLRVRASSPLGW